MSKADSSTTPILARRAFETQKAEAELIHSSGGAGVLYWDRREQDRTFSDRR